MVEEHYATEGEANMSYCGFAITDALALVNKLTE